MFPDPQLKYFRALFFSPRVLWCGPMKPQGDGYKEWWQFTSAEEETHSPLTHLQMSFTSLMNSSSDNSDFLCLPKAAGFLLYYCTVLALFKLCSIIIVMFSHRHSGVRFFCFAYCYQHT